MLIIIGYVIKLTYYCDNIISNCDLYYIILKMVRR